MNDNINPSLRENDAKPTKLFSILSLVCGIFSNLLCIFGLPTFALIPVGLGAAGIYFAVMSNKQLGKKMDGMGTAGLFFSVAGIVIGLGTFILAFAILGNIELSLNWLVWWRS